MASPTFLSMPVTVREQIYADLVTYLPPTSKRARTPSSSICKLLMVNRQCHYEVLEFLKSQLCVLVRMNDLQLFDHDILQEATLRGLPIVSQLKTKNEIAHKNSTKAPVAMEVEIYSYRSHSPSASLPVFLIPASSLKLLLEILRLPNYTTREIQSSLSLNILDIFRYSKERAEELLIQPWIDWSPPPIFFGLESDAWISKSRASTMKRRLLGNYGAPMLIYGILSLGEDARASVRSGELHGAISQYSKADKYAKLIWKCHLSSIQAESESGPSHRDLVWRLWLATEINATMLFQSVLSAARGGIVTPFIASGSAKDDAGFKQARRIGEESLRFLSNHRSYAFEATFNDPQVRTVLRNHQATTSYRLSGVCKGLGDLDAAIGYLRDALKYDPRAADVQDALKYDPKATERFTNEIEQLVKEGGKDAEEAWRGVVRWDLEADQNAHVN